MLQNDLFTFTDLQFDGDIIKTDIKLNPLHVIFEGHFPEQPILPGVCMMQMAKEVAEAYIDKQLKLIKASELKFLVIIVPEQDKVLRMELKIMPENEQMRINARLFDNDTVLFKMKGIFAEKDQ
ncbi:hypothetical protein ACFGVR_21300 [Mucilaginibacter sp. AW1-3]